MIRLAISVEGQTEEEFTNRVLATHLVPFGVVVQPILLGRARHGRGGGGGVRLERIVSEMAYLYRSFDVVTSLVDFYGFIGKGNHSVDELEDLVRERIENIVGTNENKIMPYVQKHEFEGLLLSDVRVFSEIVNVSPRAARSFEAIRASFPSPEDINDNVATAPSRRITDSVPQYRKRLHGPLIAEETGLEKIRAECPRFNAWVGVLETLQDRIHPVCP